MTAKRWKTNLGIRRKDAKRRCGHDGSSITLRAELSQEDLIAGAELLEHGPSSRPKTLSECPSGPCPYVGCRHHLYSEISAGGWLKIVWPQRDPLEIPDTCSLRVAANGEHILEDVAAYMNCTRERVRQIEAVAMRKVGRALSALGISAQEWGYHLAQLRDGFEDKALVRPDPLPATC